MAACGSSSTSASKTTTLAQASAAVVSATTSTTTTSTTSTFTPASCTASSSTQVDCALPNVVAVPYFTLTTLLSEAQAANSSIGNSTLMVITAYGGTGHFGYTNSSQAGSGGKDGAPGEAQTTTTIATWEVNYKTPLLFYYLGYYGSGTSQGGFEGGVGGLGGTSTIISPDNLTQEAKTPTLGCITNVSGTQYNQSGCSSTNIVVDAGGGGGGGEGATCDGGNGGAGGTAVATTSGPASASGSGGGGTGCSGGHGGSGGNQGNGGGGGNGGSGIDNHGGGGGNDGVGGMGGPVHSENGPSKTMPWTNVGWCMYEMGNGGYTVNGVNETCPDSTTSAWGQGGEGEWRGSTQPLGGGGSGGGGWGAGGGGGGGGNSDPGGGGGGGGTFAAASTVSTPSGFTTPSNSLSPNGGVIVSFDTGS